MGCSFQIPETGEGEGFVIKQDVTGSGFDWTPKQSVALWEISMIIQAPYLAYFRIRH